MAAKFCSRYPRTGPPSNQPATAIFGPRFLPPVDRRRRPAWIASLRAEVPPAACTCQNAVSCGGEIDRRAQAHTPKGPSRQAFAHPWRGILCSNGVVYGRSDTRGRTRPSTPKWGRGQQLRGLPSPVQPVHGTRPRQKPLSASPGLAERLPTSGPPLSHLGPAYVSARIWALWGLGRFCIRIQKPETSSAR